MDTPENTGKEREYEVGHCKPPVEHQFKPGNPGRPKGARNKLSEDFFAAMSKAFTERGEEALAQMIREKPEAFIVTIAKLQSKELTGEDGADLFPTEVVWRRASKA